MGSQDHEPVPGREGEINRETLDIHEVLRELYGLRASTPRKWFSKAIGSLEEGATFDMTIISRKLSDSPLFTNLAKSVSEHASGDPEEVPLPFVGLITQINEEEILQAEIPQTEKDRLLAELPEKTEALRKRTTEFPQRNWESGEEYLEALQAQRRHINVWMTLLTEYEPMLILQVTDTSGSSSVADFRGVILRSYYGPGSPLFDSLIDWIQQARELSGKERSEDLDWIIAHHDENSSSF